MNVEIYLHRPVGFGEHPEELGAIQDQIDLIAKEEERIQVISKYFLSLIHISEPTRLLSRGGGGGGV